MRQSICSVDAGHISDEITHVLHRSWSFDRKLIDVVTDGGKVRLTGAVRSASDRRRAAAAAWCEPGVTDVQNDIRVIARSST